ncbi:MAG: hypothetical protein HWE12_10440 [Oceanospirillaceae bacterium]|nr:hypothetical protein [Oceanospirillaceae bacterium]
MQRVDGNAEFQRLWPTLFMAIRLPGHEAANPVLTSVILQVNSQQEQLTTNYLNQNLFELNHPAISWLQQCVLRAIADYVAEAGMPKMPEVSVQAWANVNAKGDYHNLHNHPHSWLSGTYYLNVPGQTTETGSRDDLNPGCISFFDPRGAANMSALRNDGQFDPEYRRLPEAGELYLWPAFLHHFVHPNLSDDPRLSISFNVVVTNKSQHL